MTVMADQAHALRELAAEAAAAARAGAAAAPAPVVVRPEAPPVLKLARSIAIASGKGGVGKTSVSVNLAVRLAQMGRRVVLLDADLGCANADVMCNLMPTGSLAHVVAGRMNIASAMLDAPGGFKLVPGASGLAQMANLGPDQRADLLRQMQHLEEHADVLLIDIGAGIGPNVLGFMAAADQGLVVTTSEPTSIADAYALIKTLARRSANADVRVLVNMVRDEAEARAVFDRIFAVCQRFLDVRPSYAGHVIHDARVGQGVRRRRPYLLDYPACAAAACIDQLAHRLDRHAARGPGGGGWFRRAASWLSR